MDTVSGKPLVVWWRFGKEHSEESFRVNSPDVVAAHLDGKIAVARQTPTADWRWWQEDASLIVERPTPDSWLYRPDTHIYYLVERGLAVIENIHVAEWGDEWRWYIRVADIFRDEGRDAWIMQDLFCDIIVHEDNHRYRLYDLHDLGNALDMGLLTPARTSDILRRTNAALQAIEAGEFPFPEIRRGQDACLRLGW